MRTRTSAAPGTVGTSTPFILLCAFLFCTFTAGGGARPDIASLTFLRPLAVILCGYALWQMPMVRLRQYRFLLGFAALTMALPLIHLVPLPAAIWTNLPGRRLIAEIDDAAGLGSLARPLSLVPLDTWNAFYSLFLPLAVVLLVLRISPDERYRSLNLVLALGALSVIVGALQAMNPLSSKLYFYRITNSGAAVGLFANRNHQALFLAALYPMLTVYASMASPSRSNARFRQSIAIGAGVVVLPLLLITGSRAGLLTGLIGLASIPLLYVRPKPADRAYKRNWFTENPKFLTGAAFGLLALVTVLASRAEALRRLFASSAMEESRLQLWKPILSATRDFFPVGSGVGTFVTTYQVREPMELLRPEYLNHAHNDYLEVAMTGGLPALILLVLAIIGWIHLARRWAISDVRSREVRFGRLGAVLIFMIAVASVVDYPLRVPSIACLFALALTWMYGNPQRSDSTLDSDS